MAFVHANGWICSHSLSLSVALLLTATATGLLWRGLMFLLQCFFLLVIESFNSRLLPRSGDSTGCLVSGGPSGCHGSQAGVNHLHQLAIGSLFLSSLLLLRSSILLHGQ